MNPDATAQVLAQLRDIHGAPQAPWWPPAPGWWAVAVLLLAAGWWLAVRMLAARRRHQRRQRLLDYLDLLPQTLDPQAQPQAFLAAVNGLLKLVAMRAFPDQPCTALRGRAWVEFLSAGVEGGAPDDFSALAEGPYMQQPEFDGAAVHAAAQRWIRRHG